MNVEIKKLENSSVEISIHLEGEVVKNHKNTVLNKIAGSVELPGFRKGKAPIATIEAKFKEEIKEEVADLIIKDSYEEIINNNNLKPVEQLKTLSLDLTEDKFEAKFLVDVYPEITLGEYKGLEAEKETFEMSEELLNNEMEELLEKSTKLVEAEEGYAAQLEDSITLDFEGFVDGEAFEGGKAEGYSLKLGSKSFIDTFEDQLVGYQVGQEGEVKVTFPQEYFKEELAGKEAIFKVKVTAIKKLVKAILDDEFAKDNNFDSLDELKAKKTEEITERETQRIEAEYKNALVTKAVENSNLVIPASMINREISYKLSEIENNLKMQGANLEMYMQMSGLTQEKLTDQIRPVAETKVRRDVVLDAIALAENIEANEEEVVEKMESVAKIYNMELDKLKEELNKSGNLANFMENIKADVRINKTVDVLVANAK